MIVAMPRRSCFINHSHSIKRDSETELCHRRIATDEMTKSRTPHLSTRLSKTVPIIIKPHAHSASSTSASRNQTLTDLAYYRYVDEEEYVMLDAIAHFETLKEMVMFPKAGPRETLQFHPKTVCAGIVTCGGLCPGLNNVIKGVVTTLVRRYKVKKVLGFVGGFKGIYSRKPMELTLDSVEDIHHQGGSILQCHRGGFNPKRILMALKELKVSQLYIIGGDGTLTVASELVQYVSMKASSLKYPLSIAGIPKTIDNDIGIIDRSFGFDTAVTEAVKAIRSMKVEAKSAYNGVGVVKLMGRHAGFIAAHAAIASGDCDLCVLPEVPIQSTGSSSYFQYIMEKVGAKGYAVVVLAEGAGEEMLEEVMKKSERSKQLPLIHDWFQDQLLKTATAQNVELTIKYVDPSYMIRSVKAIATDAVLCHDLAEHVVHGVMSGFTGFCTGLVNNQTSYIPLSLIATSSPRQLDLHEGIYDRLVTATGQPMPMRCKRATSSKTSSSALRMHLESVANGKIPYY